MAPKGRRSKHGRISLAGVQSPRDQGGCRGEHTAFSLASGCEKKHAAFALVVLLDRHSKTCQFPHRTLKEDNTSLNQRGQICTARSCPRPRTNGSAGLRSGPCGHPQRALSGIRLGPVSRTGKRGKRGKRGNTALLVGMGWGFFSLKDMAFQLGVSTSSGQRDTAPPVYPEKDGFSRD